MLESTLKSVGQHEREREDHGVVDERLGGEQREAEDRPARVPGEQRAGDLAEAGRAALLDLDRVLGLLERRAGPCSSTSSSMPETSRSASSLRPWIISQRGLSGTLRRTSMIATASDRAEEEREPPADVGGEERLVEQHARERRAERGAEPVGAVDREVDPAARARRDQLVDRRVDRRVLAADAEAGEEAEDPERRGAPGEAGGDRGHEVERRGSRGTASCGRAGRSGSRRTARRARRRRCRTCRRPRPGSR